MQKKPGKKRWKMEKELWKKWNNRWRKKRNLNLIIDFEVEKSRQKNWTRLWNAIYYALLKKTVNIEDYNFE